MITKNDLSPRLLKAEYAVRGKITIRAQEMERQGRHIIYCNIGNPHSFKQKPLSYVREVLSLLEFPNIMSHKSCTDLFHGDSITKARYILRQIPEGLGAYTQSAGIQFVREAVAHFITKRDEIPATPERIIMTDGASKAGQFVITALTKSEKHGIMIPIPQYPMYSATLSLFGGVQIGYYLDEDNNWQLNEKALEDSIAKAKADGITPTAITVINPGNPTGAVLSYENIQMVINFARKHGIAILADEVYQKNLYDGHEFYSFAKVMHDMEINDVTLFSFHSMSKGFYGECGHRSGYMEVRNMDDETFAEIVKLQSINLCANTIGQIAMYLMVTPPARGEDSYDLYRQEKHAIEDEMGQKAKLLGEELNKIAGMKVNSPAGAMYAYVKLDLPKGHNDEDYCLQLLEKTGVCVVPGNGFGQAPNTLHFRTTFLPPLNEMDSLIAKLRKFHAWYLAKNSSPHESI